MKKLLIVLLTLSARELTYTPAILKASAECRAIEKRARRARQVGGSPAESTSTSPQRPMPQEKKST
jgi:hypothetical protein